MRTLFRFLTLTGLLIAVSVSGVFAQGSANVPLLSQVNDYASVGYNDCWGYTAPDGREYALLGVVNGTSIIDITDAANPVEITFISSNSSTWKDIKTYQDYAYVVNESGGGLQIIDLSNLPVSASLANSYTGFQTSHNIYIDEEAGILYAEGTSGIGVRVLDLADPLNPVQISTLGSGSHDVFARDDLLFVSEGTGGTFGIYDMSTPSTPQFLQRVIAPAGGYAHNAWTNEDNTLMMTTEETSTKTIKLWDISDLNNITLTDEVLGSDGIAHNAHIKGHYAYVSHYGNGLIIYDISDPANVTEVGHYDTYPSGGPGFVGAWGAFPFFASGKVLISDFTTGLYVVYFEGALEQDLDDPAVPENVGAYSDYTTPSSMSLTWTDPGNLVGGNVLQPGDFTIEIHRDGSSIASVAGGTEQFDDSGLTDGQLYTYEVFAKLIANDSSSQIVEVTWHAGGDPQPAAPANLACDSDETSVTLTWDDPTTQADGSPIDDLAGIDVYRDDALVASLAPGVQSYTDSPPGGISYRYYLVANDNENPVNSSVSSVELACYVGTTPDILVWVGDGVGSTSLASGDSIFSAIAANGYSVFLTNDLFEFGEDLGIFDAVFISLGIYPNNHVVDASDAHGPAIDLYLQNGGKVFIEGGDFLNYDPTIGGYNMRPWFDLAPGDDGAADVASLNGLGELSAFGFSYDGPNRWMDRLEPVSSTAVWQESTTSYNHGVISAEYGGGMAIAIVPLFSGFQNANKQLFDGQREAEPVAASLPSAEVRSEREVFNNSAIFQKRFAHFPQLRRDQEALRQSYVHTAGGVRINATNKTSLMAAYLGLMGMAGDSPIVGLSVSAVHDTLEAGTADDYPLTISNGAASGPALDFTVTESPAVDWLSLAPETGSVEAGSSMEVMLNFDAAGLSEGTYNCDLEIASNDAANPLIVVTVTMEVDPPTGIETERLPDVFALSQNYPNPFNPSTTIEYQLPVSSEVVVTVYNLLGQPVRVLHSNGVSAGYHQVVWNGKDNRGEAVSSGIYVYRLSAVPIGGGQEFNAIRKMIFMK